MASMPPPTPLPLNPPMRVSTKKKDYSEWRASAGVAEGCLRRATAVHIGHENLTPAERHN